MIDTMDINFFSLFQVDVIVVCSSSGELRESVLEAAGPNIRRKYEERQASMTDIETFAIKCPNLSCKEILFVPWTPSQHLVIVEQTIRSFIAEAIKYVIGRNYRSVAFPAVGCGLMGLNIDFVAQTMINHIKTEKYPLDVTFAIHPQLNNVFHAFQSVINGNIESILYYSV